MLLQKYTSLYMYLYLYIFLFLQLCDISLQFKGKFVNQMIIFNFEKYNINHTKF